MKLSIQTYIFMALVLLSLAACQETNTATVVQTTETENETYPMSTEAVYIQSYPAPGTTPIQASAFEAYQIALPDALLWNAKARLFGIPSTFLMENNLGYPGIGSGWFFMFEDPDSTLEYFIMVDNGEIKGSLEAQPIVVGERDYTYLPLPSLDTMIDSDEFINLFLKQGGNDYLMKNPQAIFNPQLYYLSIHDFPIWSLYDAANKDKEQKSLFNVNALNGEKVTIDD